MPARHVVHADRLGRGPGCAPRRSTSSRSARRSRSGGCASRTTRDTPLDLSVFSSIEFCLWDAQDDAHELPAQLLDRPGRGRRRRDLPQDRVPRAARSLRLLRLLRAAGRIRHPTRGLPRRVPRLGPAGRVERGESSNSMAHGWQPVGSHHVKLTLEPGEHPRGDLPARILGEPARRRNSTRRTRRRSTRRRAPGHRPVAATVHCGRGVATAARLLGRPTGAHSTWRPPTRTPTAWSTSGTPTSAWWSST